MEGAGAITSVDFAFYANVFKKGIRFFVNEIKVKFKGVNRHSAWLTIGRTMSKAKSELDVNLIKDMNMNAVRMSHHPPDSRFLDVCDSLGLFVIDELT
ncbi:glycoside hydrolase family 2 TIM barrel-domain containing protein [Olivibacter domesticus]|uniref:glycoside hydrolase family 2 TIM barrel-domain containing protein n=1 Tax=Olivibacter domesticus TaxID=407022 RepID=UPI002937399A|nr:glycoside hydrolase family 2 TIM barrel-domain containing protein [Olivibacter domesticus]